MTQIETMENEAAEREATPEFTAEREQELLTRVSELEEQISDLRLKSLMAKPAMLIAKSRPWSMANPLMPCNTREALERALASANSDLLSEQLKLLDERYQEQRAFNSRLLSRLQKTQSKIQVSPLKKDGQCAERHLRPHGRMLLVLLL